MNTLLKRTVAVIALAMAWSITQAAGATNSIVVAGVEINKDPELAKLLPEKYRENGLRVEYTPPKPPFFMLHDSGESYGALIDFVNAIAARLGTTVTLSKVSHDAHIPALQAGTYDFTLGIDADTVGRQQIVNMIDYMQAGVSLIVAEGNPLNITGGKDLCGKRLAVLKGWSPPDYFDSLSVACKERGLPAVDIKTLPSTPDTVLAVRSGAVDGTFSSTPGAQAVVKDGGLTLVAPEDSPLGWNLQLNGLMVLKQNNELTEALSATVDSLLADGTLKKVYREYGLDERLVLDRVVVNQALPETGLD